MSKFWYNGVIFGSNDSRDIMYDGMTVYDKLTELTLNGGGGNAPSPYFSSYSDLDSSVTIERSGCSRVLQFKGDYTVLRNLLIHEDDRPSREICCGVVGMKMSGETFLDVIEIHRDGTITSKCRVDESESVRYFASIPWIVAVTENDTPTMLVDDTIRYNSANGQVEVFKGDSWEALNVIGGTDDIDHEIVSELPSKPDSNTMYIIDPKK